MNKEHRFTTMPVQALYMKKGGVVKKKRKVPKKTVSARATVHNKITIVNNSSRPSRRRVTRKAPALLSQMSIAPYAMSTYNEPPRDRYNKPPRDIVINLGGPTLNDMKLATQQALIEHSNAEFKKRHPKPFVNFHLDDPLFEFDPDEERKSVSSSNSSGYIDRNNSNGARFGFTLGKSKGGWHEF